MFHVKHFPIFVYFAISAYLISVYLTVDVERVAGVINGNRLQRVTGWARDHGTVGDFEYGVMRCAANLVAFDFSD